MEKKTFACRLAEKSSRDTGKWKARDGLLAAGRTDTFPPYILRYNVLFGHDNGSYC